MILFFREREKEGPRRKRRGKRGDERGERERGTGFLPIVP